MGNYYYRSVVVITIFIYIVINIQGGRSDFGKSARQLCGKKLADALQQACAGEYNSLYDKTSVDVPDYAYQSDQDDQFDNEYTRSRYPFRSRPAASTTFRIFRRHTRGIIDECCHKPCSFSELTTYCAPRPY